MTIKALSLESILIDLMLPMLSSASLEYVHSKEEGAELPAASAALTLAANGTP